MGKAADLLANRCPPAGDRPVPAAAARPGRAARGDLEEGDPAAEGTQPFTPPADRPLLAASYCAAAAEVTAAVQPFAVGRAGPGHPALPDGGRALRDGPAGGDLPGRVAGRAEGLAGRAGGVSGRLVLARCVRRAGPPVHFAANPRVRVRVWTGGPARQSARPPVQTRFSDHRDHDRCRRRPASSAASRSKTASRPPRPATSTRRSGTAAGSFLPPPAGTCHVAHAAVAVQPDGRIVLAGSAGPTGTVTTLTISRPPG